MGRNICCRHRNLNGCSGPDSGPLSPALAGRLFNNLLRESSLSTWLFAGGATRTACQCPPPPSPALPPPCPHPGCPPPPPTAGSLHRRRLGRATAGKPPPSIPRPSRRDPRWDHTSPLATTLQVLAHDTIPPPK